MKTMLFKNFYTLGVIVLLGSALLSCKSTEIISSPAYNVTLESASPGRDAVHNIEDILKKNHYTVNERRASSHRTMYLQTDWTPKDILNDEMVNDAIAIRTRIVVESNLSILDFCTDIVLNFAR